MGVSYTEREVGDLEWIERREERQWVGSGARSEVKGSLGIQQGEMHERLWTWRREEPEASFDEIMERARQEREAVMKPLLEELVGEAGEVDVDVCCPEVRGASAEQGEEEERDTTPRGSSRGKSSVLLLPFV